MPDSCLQGDHYTWTKVPTAVHNIVVGNPWVDQHGTMTISNHANGDKCTLTFDIILGPFLSSKPHAP